jgi:uncharacterized membrane protein YsdA (DUF1294 family)
LSVAATLILGVFYVRGLLPIRGAQYFLAVNAWVIVMYALDKFSAVRGIWRFSNATMHAWSLLGGWPAAFFGQSIFNHKTVKTSFQITHWSCVFANIACVVVFTHSSS